MNNGSAARSPTRDSVGIVVIGRNEGDRLKRCLESISEYANRTVYVDSSSTDGSVAAVRARCVAVIELDLGRPFTAARARNAGFERLLQLHPELNYVFFVDGDCEVIVGWIEKASRFLDEHSDVALVCGRRREKYPERSVYNMLCDMEWDTPIGETKACGGDAMIRAKPLQFLQGYRSDLICGEEPELCVRLRRASWRLWRLDEEMTIHDAAIYRFSQWWKRMMRGGYAFAQGVNLHGARPERLWVRESRRAWMWGLCFPLAVIILASVASGWILLLLCAYPLQVIHLALKGRRSTRENWWRAGALAFCKFPEAAGQLKFLLDRYRGIQSPLIEYK